MYIDVACVFSIYSILVLGHFVLFPYALHCFHPLYASISPLLVSGTSIIFVGFSFLNLEILSNFWFKYKPVKNYRCPLEKDETTDKRSADLLITVVNYMARYEPPHNKTDWRRAQRPRTTSALVAMRKLPPGPKPA